MIEAKKSRLGDLILSKKVVPQHVIKEGTHIIDGVHLKFEKVKNSEADFQLLIMLKDIETIIAQDIVYNNVHLFLGNNKFDDWISVLEKLKNQKEYKIILAGHGMPMILSDTDNMITYLKYSKDIFGNVKSSMNFKEKLITKYPSYKLPVFLDLSNKYLFKN